MAEPRIRIINKDSVVGSITSSEWLKAKEKGWQLAPPNIAEMSKDSKYKGEPPAEKPPVDALEAYAGHGLQGMTFGFGDELVSGLGAALTRTGGDTFGDRYRKWQQVQKDSLEQSAKERPAGTTAANITGAVSTALVPGPAILRGAQAAAKVPGYAGRIWNAAKAGGAAGGAAGAGAPPEGQRTAGAFKGMLTGAGLGGTVTAAAPAVTAPVKAVGQKILDALPAGTAQNLMGRLPGLITPSARAEEKVLESIGNDMLGDTLPQALDRLHGRVSRANQLGKTDYTLADAGGNAMLRRADTAMLRPGKAQSQADKALWNRQAGSGDRVVADLEYASGASGDAATVSKALKANRRTGANKAYDAAYGHPRNQSIDDPLINEYLELPQFKEAWKSLRELESYSPGGALPEEIPGRPSLKLLDGLKQRMGNVVNHMKRETDSQKVGKLEHELGVFTKRLEEIAPGYSEALQAYKGPSRMDEALTEGQKFLQPKSTVSKITEDLSGKFNTIPEKEHYLLGVVDAVREKINGRRPGDDTFDVIMGNKNKRMALQRLFESVYPAHGRKAFLDFANRMHLEERMNKTRGFIKGNSRTPERLAGMADEGFDAANAALQVGQGNVAAPALNWLTSRGKEHPNALAEEITPLLLGNPFEAIERLRRAHQAAAAKGQSSTGAETIGTVTGLLTGR